MIFDVSNEGLCPCFLLIHNPASPVIIDLIYFSRHALERIKPVQIPFLQGFCSFPNLLTLLLHFH